MGKIAVLMAEGYEEGETLTIVDILRRAGLTCDTFYFGDKLVKGMHGIYVEGDKPFGEEVKGYDMVVLPGDVQVGRTCAKIRKSSRWFNILMSIKNI